MKRGFVRFVGRPLVQLASIPWLVVLTIIERVARIIYDIIKKDRR